MNDAIRLATGLIFPLLLLVFVFIFLRQISGGFKSLGAPSLSNLRDITNRAEIHYEEQKEFQRELLAELRRHNNALERQAETLSQLLERLARS